jgi:hypothetical protein
MWRRPPLQPPPPSKGDAETNDGPDDHHEAQRSRDTRNEGRPGPADLRAHGLFHLANLTEGLRLPRIGRRHEDGIHGHSLPRNAEHASSGLGQTAEHGANGARIKAD